MSDFSEASLSPEPDCFPVPDRTLIMNRDNCPGTFPLIPPVSFPGLALVSDSRCGHHLLGDAVGNSGFSRVSLVPLQNLPPSREASLRFSFWFPSSFSFFSRYCSVSYSLDALLVYVPAVLFPPVPPLSFRPLQKFFCSRRFSSSKRWPPPLFVGGGGWSVSCATSPLQPRCSILILGVLIQKTEPTLPPVSPGAQ